MKQNRDDDLYNLMSVDCMKKTINDMCTLFIIEDIVKQDYLSYKAKVLAIKSIIDKNRNTHDNIHSENRR